MSLKEKLTRFKSDLVSEKDEKKSVTTAENQGNRGQSELLGATPFYFDGQCAWIREVSYPLQMQHGRYRFFDLKESVAAWNERESLHPLSANGLSFDDLLFFDTETTGLGGGVGNTIFLIGCGRVLEDRVIVKQFFLPSPGDEVALYQAFLTDVKELKNLVTYNGKAFDWPQIKTRHTFLRDAVPKLPAFGHFDLLHAARRLWKDTLESGRLSVVERDILGVQRRNDTPGHLVPLYYFEYVKERNPEIIRGVLEHNEYDILSLITLYTHVSELLLSRHPATPKEWFEVGRWYEYIGIQDNALACFKRVAGNVSQESLLAKKHMAAIFKRQKRYHEAMAIWEQLVEISEVHHPDVFIQMAKVYEHHDKDIDKALYCSKKAYQINRQRKRLRIPQTEKEQDTLKRINRLERKLTFLQ